ncbi:MAG TPA: sporulation YhaL family protein [Pseudogracilibacillus sp.]|nr:sporulation YhaL family protein [Pseudogracilibacillus sp.]
MLFNIPWWVYLVIVFIIFSGYMSFRAMRAEKILEQQYIEREGQVYMERIRQEKMRKEHVRSD